MTVLTPQQIDRFWAQGYLVAAGGATATQLAAIGTDVDRRLDK